MSTTAHAVGFSFVERLAQDLRDERLELPAFPEAVIRIQRALQSPDTSTDDVVRILSSEPALAARLLRMANSAEFRRVDQSVTDLRKAVARMAESAGVLEPSLEHLAADVRSCIPFEQDNPPTSALNCY